MEWVKRNLGRGGGDQGRLRKSRPTSHEPPQSRSRSKDLEQPSPEGHVTSRPVLSDAECMFSKQEENPESSTVQEDQPTMDERLEHQEAEPDSSQCQETVALVNQEDQLPP